MADNKPIMAKATAVWLVDNTTITFKQVADFCGLHELEVQGIADGDVATGVKGGFDPPVANNQLTQEEIDKAEANPLHKLKLKFYAAAVGEENAAVRATPPRCRNARTARIRSCGWSSSTRNCRTARSPSWWAPPSRRSSRSASARTGTSRTWSRSTRSPWACASRPSWTWRCRRRTRKPRAKAAPCRMTSAASWCRPRPRWAWRPNRRCRPQSKGLRPSACPTIRAPPKRTRRKRSSTRQLLQPAGQCGGRRGLILANL